MLHKDVARELLKSVVVDVHLDMSHDAMNDGEIEVANEQFRKAEKAANIETFNEAVDAFRELGFNSEWDVNDAIFITISAFTALLDEEYRQMIGVAFR